MSPTSTRTPNTLMLTHVMRMQATSHHLAYMCSAGPQGYHAVKEMLLGGGPGHAMMIESDDLRNVGVNSDDGGSDNDALTASTSCCLVYSSFTGPLHVPYNEQIPKSVPHVAIYSNQRRLMHLLLRNCAWLTSIDLTTLSRVVREVGAYFLDGCTGLTCIDLTPLSRITAIDEGFMRRCNGLTSIDLRPLSKAKDIGASFLADCKGIPSADLTPLKGARMRKWPQWGPKQHCIVE